MGNNDICSICDKPLYYDTEKIDCLKVKELKNLILKSQITQDNKWKMWADKSCINVHSKCRKSYSVQLSAPKKRKLESTESLPSTSSQTVSESLDEALDELSISYECDPPSSSTNDFSASNNPELSLPLHKEYAFDYFDKCIFCESKLDRKHKKVNRYTGKISKDHFLKKLREKESGDAEIIVERIENAISLKHPFFYHEKCYSKIMQVSRETSTHVKQSQVAYKKLFQHIENSGEFKFTLKDLKDNLGSFHCANITLFKKLKERFGEDIFIVQTPGKPTVLYYQTIDLAKLTPLSWYVDPSNDLLKKKIVSLAASLIKEEMKSFPLETKSYPPAFKFLDTVKSNIPPLLGNVLEDILEMEENDEVEKVSGKSLKRDNIAHCMISTLRPSLISPLQLSIGTYIYRKTGSQLVIDLLSKFGVSPSYYLLRLYEASTIMDPPNLTVQKKTFVQHIFDNTDHNVKTLDGSETFHCLGGVAVYTPKENMEYTGGTIKCVRMPSASDLAKQKAITFTPYQQPKEEKLSDISFVDVDSLHCSKLSFLTPVYAAYIWGKSLDIPKLPTWKGFMEKMSYDVTFEQSHVKCLPFVNSPPSNLTTLNTALHYARKECDTLKQKTCFVTFDQPLYIKARTIVSESESLKGVKVRLGGFHLLMSYLGSVGYIMNGSGLQDLWATIYAADSVKKMITGHAYARSLRAHILTFTTLASVVCKTIETAADDKEHIKRLLSAFDEDLFISDKIKADETIKKVSDLFLSRLGALEKQSPTAKLWVQYYKFISVALQFIEAERLGNWQLHLLSIREMLPVFHASGHFAYAKSAQIYLQDMSTLEYDMDFDELRQFTEDGFFTIRRSDKAWSGVWSDMVIEQTLNRFFGTDLKHGRGVTWSVIARYILAMPAVFEVMLCLENYATLHSHNSEQHVDLSKSRIIRDNADIEKMEFWFNEHNPFPSDCSLISLSTGIIGGSDINCHMAIERGLLGMQKMVGFNASKISLTATYKVKPLALAATSSHIIDEHFINIDSQLLFQRIAVVLKGDEEMTRAALRYELSPFPLSLFDQNGLMRKTNKAELYKLFKSHLLSEQLLNSFYYVVDGGWLLHKFVWPTQIGTFGTIFEGYLKFVVSSYGINATVVFDGYNNELIGTKSYERYRRKERTVAADVFIAEDKVIQMKQTKFFSNVANKYKFVLSLTQYMKNRGINIKIADEDADTLIVRTAIELNETHQSVCIVGNDVDLLILGIPLTPIGSNIYFLKDIPKKPYTLYSTRDNKEHQPYILFAHSFVGCDTTSAMYKIGKKAALKVLQINEHLQQEIKVFDQPDKSEEELYSAAQKVIMALYKSLQSEQTIPETRYRLFIKSITTSKKSLQLAVLPPTEAALRQHTKRVYYQIQTWLGRYLNPADWGWKRTQFMLIPVMTDQPPAPLNLIEKISCSCVKDCSSRCSCIKSGVKCTQMCKYCNGESCTNSGKRITPEIDEETDEIEEAENCDIDIDWDVFENDPAIEEQLHEFYGV